jgi:hypothetical protein
MWLAFLHSSYLVLRQLRCKVLGNGWKSARVSFGAIGNSRFVIRDSCLRCNDLAVQPITSLFSQARASAAGLESYTE